MLRETKFCSPMCERQRRQTVKRQDRGINHTKTCILWSPVAGSCVLEPQPLISAPWVADVSCRRHALTLLLCLSCWGNSPELYDRLCRFACWTRLRTGGSVVIRQKLTPSITALVPHLKSLRTGSRVDPTSFWERHEEKCLHIDIKLHAAVFLEEEKQAGCFSI